VKLESGSCDVMVALKEPRVWGGGVMGQARSASQSWVFYKPRQRIKLRTERVLPFFRDLPMSYGSSQARGQIGATDAGLHHNHSNIRSEPLL